MYVYLSILIYTYIYIYIYIYASKTPLLILHPIPYKPSSVHAWDARCGVDSHHFPGPSLKSQTSVVEPSALAAQPQFSLRNKETAYCYNKASCAYRSIIYIYISYIHTYV